MAGGPSNSLPWVLGADPSAGFQFGVLFNSPALGGVAFGPANMTWSIIGDADNQKLRQQFDFLITTHGANATPAEKPFQMISKYVDAVGHARRMPYPGYWHSKNRYASQDELLTAARGFHARGIPVDVIVIDYNHWITMGDFGFDRRAWPDPRAMVEECRSYGMEIMVSVWPFSCPGSRSYEALQNQKNGLTTYAGTDTPIALQVLGAKNCSLIDPTRESTREYVWSLIKTGYYQYGIKIFWLDADEPVFFGPLSTNASWSLGSMRDMGSLFSLYWTQAFFDGLQEAGEQDAMILSRAGWVGTWRHGAALWSGDIGSTMAVLKSQINIGISAQTSGIPWWTTDVGGYHGGQPADLQFEETVARWFQYGFTCPMLRQHGERSHTCPWFYGNRSEAIIEDIIRLRHAMKPYFSAQLDRLNETGRPFNRPLTWDFPNDPRTWELAENGIGDTADCATLAAPSEHGSVQNGDFVVLAVCNASAPTQQWTLGNNRLTLASNVGYCVDMGGTRNAKPPSGPYALHMWTCTKVGKFPAAHAAQTWSFDPLSTILADPQKNDSCITLGDGRHPGLATGQGNSSCAEWSFSGPLAHSDAGALHSGGKCLAVVPYSERPSPSPVSTY